MNKFECLVKLARGLKHRWTNFIDKTWIDNGLVDAAVTDDLRVIVSRYKKCRINKSFNQTFPSYNYTSNGFRFSWVITDKLLTININRQTGIVIQLIVDLHQEKILDVIVHGEYYVRHVQILYDLIKILGLKPTFEVLDLMNFNYDEWDTSLPFLIKPDNNCSEQEWKDFIINNIMKRDPNTIQDALNVLYEYDTKEVING